MEDVSGFILNVVGMTRFWFVCLNGETFFQKKRFCFILETLNLRWCWCSKLGLLVLMSNSFPKETVLFHFGDYKLETSHNVV